MQKLPALCLLVCLALLCCACGKTAAPAETAPPAFHTIAPDADLGTLDDADGADAFANSLDHPDTVYYAVNDYYNMRSGGGLHILSQFETYQQTTEYSCGCAAALMVLNRYGIAGYDELEICALAKADETHGTSVEGLASFLEGVGLRVDYHADTDFRFSEIADAEAYLVEQLDAGRPVMVDWVDWAGHWQVVIGLDECGTDDPYDDVLIMADPYDVTDHWQDGYYVVPFGRFFYMWREGPCTANDVPFEQPFVTAYRP